MSDPVLNSMLRVAPPSPPGGRPAADQAGRDGVAGADSFAQALERRLESADRPAFRPTREPASEKTGELSRREGDTSGSGPANSATAAGPATSRAADDRASEGIENSAPAPEPGPASSATGAESQTTSATDTEATATDITALKASDAAVTATTIMATGSAATMPPTIVPETGATGNPDTGIPGVATGLPPAIITTGSIDGTDKTGQDAAPVPATPATDNPAVAASIAVLLQGIAATLPGITPPADTSAGTESPPLLLSGDMPVTSAQGSGATKLERLIAQVGERSGTRPDTPAGGFDLRTGALPIPDHNASDTITASDTAPSYAATRLQDPLQTAQTTTATTSGALNTPATALQPAHPELQAAGLQGSVLSSAPRSEAAPTPQLPVHTPAGQAAWAEDVGNRVVWMFGRQESRAELVLTPAHLGKLEVSIQVNGDQTTAQFVAASAAARDALEQALPRLREVLQQAGINLGQTSVSTSGDQRAQQDSGTGNARRGRNGAGDDTSGGVVAADTGPARWTTAGRGIVDTFA